MVMRTPTPRGRRSVISPTAIFTSTWALEVQPPAEVEQDLPHAALELDLVAAAVAQADQGDLGRAGTEGRLAAAHAVGAGETDRRRGWRRS